MGCLKSSKWTTARSSSPKRSTLGHIDAVSNSRLVAQGHRPTIRASRPASGRLRQECLDQQWFFSLEEARNCLEEWRRDYNTIRPHTALGNQTPADFAANWRKQQAARETG